MKNSIPKFVLRRKCGMRVLPENENFITVNITGKDPAGFIPFHLWSKLTNHKIKRIIFEIMSGSGFLLDEVESVTVIHNGYQTEYFVEVPDEI